MKKLLLITSLAASPFLFALDAIRIDIQCAAETRIAQVAAGKLSVSTTPAKTDTNITRAVLFSGNLTGKWQKFEFSFIPEKDGRIVLRFHTPGSRNVKNIKPVMLDDVKCEGGTLLNGDFEAVHNNVLTNWRLGKDGKIISGSDVYSGKQCVQVFFNSGMAVQTIIVTAGEKVTISFQAKLP